MVIMFVISVIVLNTTGFLVQSGMVGIRIFGPQVLTIVVLGFVAGFYFVFRKSSLRIASRR